MSAIHSSSPQEYGVYQPAEWSPHSAFWSAWPVHVSEWGEQLVQVQTEVAGLFRAIYDQGQGETPKILVRSSEDISDFKRMMGSDWLGVEVFVEAPYGDIWLRDTAPIFLQDQSRALASVRFRFNGWGEKFDLPGDSEVSTFVQTQVEGEQFCSSMVLEGGSVEVDGEGTLLTSRQCLLEKRRNPAWAEQQICEHVSKYLGVEKVLWLNEGLKNDHTDGHIDTLARFVAPGTVVCMHPQDSSDPNYSVLEEIYRDLKSMVDARGRKLQVVRVPSPGAVFGQSGELLPASYMNFYIANTRVVVPTYGVRADSAAVDSLSTLFPDREVIGCSARALIEGGGAFHCITQQEPKS